MPTSQPVRPILTIATFILTSGVTTRTSEASTNANPPPVAAPWARQMIGCGQRRMR